VGDQGGLAGNALPSAVLADPGISESSATREGLASLYTFITIGAVHDGGVSVDAHDHAIVVDLLVANVALQSVVQVLGFVQEGAVVVDVDKRLGEELIEGVGVLALSA
jgi:hypothetical protein